MLGLLSYLSYFRSIPYSLVVNLTSILLDFHLEYPRYFLDFAQM